MAGELTIPFQGNLTTDPELRFTPSGAAVAKFRIIDTPRIFDRQTNEWKDVEGNPHDLVVWRAMAENCAETLRKGSRVVGHGIVKTERWDDKETGQPRSKQIIEVLDIGPSLKFATAQVAKAQRNQQSNQQGGGGWGGNQQGGQQPQNDGWGNQNDNNQQGGNASGGDPWGGGNAGNDSGNDPWA